MFSPISKVVVSSFFVFSFFFLFVVRGVLYILSEYCSNAHAYRVEVTATSVAS